MKLDFFLALCLLTVSVSPLQLFSSSTITIIYHLKPMTTAQVQPINLALSKPNKSEIGLFTVITLIRFVSLRRAKTEVMEVAEVN